MPKVSALRSKTSTDEKEASPKLKVRSRTSTLAAPIVSPQLRRRAHKKKSRTRPLSARLSEGDDNIRNSTSLTSPLVIDIQDRHSRGTVRAYRRSSSGGLVSPRSLFAQQTGQSPLSGKEAKPYIQQIPLRIEIHGAAESGKSSMFFGCHVLSKFNLTFVFFSCCL